jgi:hypothetical protein
MKGRNTRAIVIIVLSLSVVLALSIAAIAAHSVRASGQTGVTATPDLITKIPVGFRDWKLVSVAHEAGNLNDIRGILANDVGIKAYREGKLPYPDGTIIARIAWDYTASEENNKVFGREQSFVAGGPTATHLQFMVKDSRKYSATGGWGFAQFNKDGKPADAAELKPCFPCHQPVKDRDFVFTRYSP